MHKIVRKRRTRQHVIADLAVNHVERIVLQCGNTVERFWHDYGFDLLLYTSDNNGEYENGDVRLQVKATDHLRPMKGGPISLRLEWTHLRHWLSEPMPVILIVYDAKQDAAYWLYIQRYFEARRGFPMTDARGTVSVKIPNENTLNGEAVRQLARFRNNILAQARGVIRHHD